MKKYILCILMLLLPTSGWAADYYTAATARTQVRSYIDESSASFWSNDEIDNFVQEGVEDVSARALCITKADKISLVTGTYEYTDMDTAGSDAIVDVVKVWGCVYENPDDEYIGLKRIEAWQIADLMQMEAGPPVYYYHFANKIGILPIPASGQNGDDVRVYYSGQSQTIGDLPNEFQTLSIWYAVAMCFAKEHRFTESKKFYAMYMQKLESLRSDLYNVKPEYKEK